MLNRQNWPEVAKAVVALRKGLGLLAGEEIAFGLVLGTGLNSISLAIKDSCEVPFSALPYFPKPLNASHQGAFVLGTLNGVRVLVQAGRCHLYEGYAPEEVCLPVRVMAGLGVKTLFLSNAAGGLNPEFKIGRLMVLTDQLNFTGVSPLTGPNDEAYGLRFPDMSCPFDRKLISLAEETARELNLPLERGIYVGVHGPELETRAETRFYRSLGADAIGMSSVLEVICARHLGLRVLAFSIIANLNLPDCMQEILLEDVLAASSRAEADLLQLWQRILPKLLPK